MSSSTGQEAELDGLLHRAAAEPVRYPPGLVARSLRTVRSVRGFAADQAVQVDQRGGLLTVSRHAVSAIVQRLGERVCATLGGLRMRSVRFDGNTVEVSVAVAYGTPMTQAEELRAVLEQGLASYLGVSELGVLMHIADAYHPFE